MFARVKPFESRPVVDEGKLEERVALVFRNMMSSLYSVLDQVYYFLYCHYQNNGEASFAAQAFQINAPFIQNLKWSADATTEQQSWSRKREKWLDERCKEIFGPLYSPDNQDMKWFRRNLLSLQAVREVNNAGDPVRNNDDEISLVHFFNGQFTPLCSTKDNWRDATSFNLLHFYRNFTTHRTLLQTMTGEGHLNLSTRVFAPAHTLSDDEINNGEWIRVGKGLFIIVPELSDLRDTTRDGAPKFYMKPLLMVCTRLFTFVKTQRDNLVNMAVQNHDYPYNVSWYWDNLTVNKGNHRWSKSWSDWDSTRLDMD